jgi:hypothetical protein
MRYPDADKFAGENHALGFWVFNRSAPSVAENL